MILELGLKQLYIYFFLYTLVIGQPRQCSRYIGVPHGVIVEFSIVGLHCLRPHTWLCRPARWGHNRYISAIRVIHYGKNLVRCRQRNTARFLDSQNTLSQRRKQLKEVLLPQPSCHSNNRESAILFAKTPGQLAFQIIIVRCFQHRIFHKNNRISH